MACADFQKDLEERRGRFWQQVCRSAASHPEWTADGVRDFFLWWTEPTRDGRMKWELEATFGIGQRMNSYMKRRRWLQALYEARLERARGARPQGPTSALEQRRARAVNDEAQSAYDAYFAEQEQRRSAAAAAAAPREAQNAPQEAQNAPQKAQNAPPEAENAPREEKKP